MSNDKLATPKTSTPFEGATFNIIHHRGQPNTAVTLSGHTVKREEKLYLVEMNTQLGLPSVLHCAQYDDHFVYIDPENVAGRWFAMCTCGAPAVIVNSSQLVCYHHASTGHHATGGSRWV